jgi:hypothetical protein
MAAGRTKTTWTKGTNPVKKKGTKARKTILKESLGLKGWEKLNSFLQNEGATKMVDTLAKLSEKEFAFAYGQMLEFIRPKLTRTTHVGDAKNPLELRSGIDISKLTPEQQLALYNAMTSDGAQVDQGAKH